MSSCRFVSSGEPRAVRDRHAVGCPGDDCEGCLPCTEPHCGICRRVHADVTCAECVAHVRADLHGIAELCGALSDEVAHRGIAGEAMVLLGPVADPEAWRNRATAAMFGRLDAAYLEDCRDEQHPLWVLGTWEQLWRNELDQATDLEATLPRLVDYLDGHLALMAGRLEPPFEDFARDLRGCRAHLEDVLSAGTREVTGAPCVQCGSPMIQVITDHGAQDAYHCRPCRRRVTGDQYRYAVSVAYLAHATALPAADIAARLGVRARVVTTWGARGLVRKHGRSQDGRTLYDVGDAVARHDRPPA